MRKNKSFSFDKIAGQYARYRETHPGVLRSLLINISKDSKVLEVGCGTGNYIIMINLISGCQSWGIDISREMLSKAQDRSKSVNFKLSDATKMDFPDNFFDLVFSVNVIHHIKDL
ncbi:MAG TPA: class I SAM-dependent methyltransferase, partial [bacterium]|nr:class I SAM-dependent methyltransferase [bacterium]